MQKVSQNAPAPPTPAELASAPARADAHLTQQRLKDHLTSVMPWAGAGLGLGALFGLKRQFFDTVRPPVEAPEDEEAFDVPAPLLRKTSAWDAQTMLDPALKILTGMAAAGGGYSLVKAISDRNRKSQQEENEDDAKAELRKAVQQQYAQHREKELLSAKAAASLDELSKKAGILTEPTAQVIGMMGALGAPFFGWSAYKEYKRQRELHEEAQVKAKKLKALADSLRGPAPVQLRLNPA